MTKAALASAIAFRHKVTRAEAVRIIDTMTDMIGHLLEEHGRMNLSGFGCFAVKARPARRARNPRTGETMVVPARRVVVFQPAPALKGRANRSAAVADD